MFDFTSDFWPWFINVPVVIGLISMYLLIIWMQKKPEEGSLDGEPLEHKWDETLVELNNPMPSWWVNMFYLTLIFAAVYLLLYPGLGTWKGLLGWTQAGQYESELEKAEEIYGPIYAAYLEQDVVALSEDDEARKTGHRLFSTYCAICHGSDARGSRGFPNLANEDWLYGGNPEAIKTSITQGRNGVMPAWEQVLGKEGVFNVAEYVLSLSGRKVNETAARLGQDKFQQLCVSCHAADGTGNQALGAPNLTDNVWLYSGSQRAVIETISNGRSGRMPKHEGFLDEAKIHLLTAYVYGLSAGDNE
ncbi:cytochrome-c oxidase, cbb3-type subunit III [Sulfuriflexus sp.]|uniref:cytochrome-c oxidase, cbb3-type subunit III n=1 Tax=Sulfuriflexus sp. TaxID=2015443 RepID=UPI0028CED6EC|nr:cytochrome-c oxidase, cbb3-type subunit III [Sulfuriflexus sp.]MDT8403622.1 cytochrome-c oxidase, cbb3-type subunit III [Sulfuriflexus sp.]